MYTVKPVLLLEDDHIDQKAVKMAFEKLMIQNKLIILENGEEGLKYLKGGERPCLIILDLNMPRMNGLEFLDVVKKDPHLKSIPIIVFTTSREEEEKIKAYDRHVVGYIVKPPDHKKFADIFRTIDIYWTISEAPLK